MHFIANLLFVTSIRPPGYNKVYRASEHVTSIFFFFFFLDALYINYQFTCLCIKIQFPHSFLLTIYPTNHFWISFFNFASLLINLASFKYVCTIVVECMRHCYKKWGNVIRIYKLFTNFDSVEVFCLPVVIFLNHRL